MWFSQLVGCFRTWDLSLSATLLLLVMLYRLPPLRVGVFGLAALLCIVAVKIMLVYAFARRVLDLFLQGERGLLGELGEILDGKWMELGYWLLVSMECL